MIYGCSRNWVATFPNWKQADWDLLEKMKAQFLEGGGVNQTTIGCVGEEIGEQFGLRHLQVAISFKSEYCMEQVKQILGRKVHLEMKAKDSTLQEMFSYPMKGLGPKWNKKDPTSEKWTFFHPGPNWEGFFWGTFPVGQGRRTDIRENCLAILNDGLTVDDILLADPQAFHNNGRTYQATMDLANRKRFRSWMTEGIWYWGKTGTGKSHHAFEGYSNETHYIVVPAMAKTGFWDGYTGQEIVVWNEFRGGCAYGELMDLVDKHPKMMNIKGRLPIPFLARKFIITSPKSPEMTYPGIFENKEEDPEQFYRRFRVEELTETCEQRARKAARVSLLQGEEAKEEE